MGLSFKQKIISSILKCIVIVSAILGIVFSALAASDSFMGGETVFMYFTIQSNIAILLVSAIGYYFMFKNINNNIWNIIKFVFTISITLTGMVFSFVLAPTMGIAVWSFTNILTHVVVPICAVVDFFVVGLSFEIKKRSILFVVIPPLLYVVYAAIGYGLNWKFTKSANYPYFFLNWGSDAGAFGFSSKLPFMGVVWWIILLSLFLVGVGYLYLKISDILKKKLVKNS